MGFMWAVEDRLLSRGAPSPGTAAGSTPIPAAWLFKVTALPITSSGDFTTRVPPFWWQRTTTGVTPLVLWIHPMTVPVEDCITPPVWAARSATMFSIIPGRERTWGSPQLLPVLAAPPAVLPSNSNGMPTRKPSSAATRSISGPLQEPTGLLSYSEA